MKVFPAIYLLVLTPLLLFATPDETVRQWTDSNGRQITATFVKLESGNVFLKLSSGSTITIPLTSLSNDSSTLAQKLATPVGPAPRPAQVSGSGTNFFFRNWTDDKGQVIQAALLSIETETAQLKLKSGEVLAIPLHNLSRESKGLARYLMTPKDVWGGPRPSLDATSGSQLPSADTRSATVDAPAEGQRTPSGTSVKQARGEQPIAPLDVATLLEKLLSAKLTPELVVDVLTALQGYSRTTKGGERNVSDESQDQGLLRPRMNNKPPWADPNTSERLWVTNSREVRRELIAERFEEMARIVFRKLDTKQLGAAESVDLLSTLEKVKPDNYTGVFDWLIVGRIADIQNPPIAEGNDNPGPAAGAK